MYEAEELDVLARWTRPHENPATSVRADVATAGASRPKFLDQVTSLSSTALAGEIQQWMLAWLAERVEEVGEGPLSAESTFAELGIDSLTAVELNMEFEKTLGLRLPPLRRGATRRPRPCRSFWPRACSTWRPWAWDQTATWPIRGSRRWMQTWSGNHLAVETLFRRGVREVREAQVDKLSLSGS
jgi:acyl carrier protein